VKFRELLHLSESARDDQALERSVRETMEWIQSSVDGSGLTAYWPGGRGYVSLTAWVVQFLVEAQEAGFPVDRALREALERSLEQALRSDYSRFIDGESYAERTWALSALSSLSGAGRANEAYAAELARRTDTLNQESRTLQAHARSVGKAAAAETPTPAQALLLTTEDDEYGIDDDAEEQTDAEAIESASKVLPTPEAKARELLNELVSLAEQYRGAPDAKVLARASRRLALRP